jgi:molecular chaperone DnaK
MGTYGIDLGTTYSCIAYVNDTNRPVVVKNALGEDATPSVVFFETEDNVVIGREAKNSAKVYPDRVVSLIKRQMGKDDVELEFYGDIHTPVTISSLILRELCRSAEQNTHDKVRDVVITVPAYFGVRAREATRAAGEIAGLNVLNIVPEPVAAALHYEAINSGSDRTILVYDLGGGTFDTTVIRIEDQNVRVLCTYGDHELGGADWDERIADLLLRRFVEEHPGTEAAGDEDFLQDLATSAEDLKRALSSVETRRYNAKFGDEVSRIELTRTVFENATADLLERTFVITQRTIDAARERGVTNFDDVLLVGGSTRMPTVTEGLRSRFGFAPKLHDPDLAVAKGAALFALIESVKIVLPTDADADTAEPSAQAVEAAAAQLGIDADNLKTLMDKKVTAVVPRAFGVKVVATGGDIEADAEGFVIDHLLHANTALPATPPTEKYGTAQDGQTGIIVEIWEQAGPDESPRVSDNEKIGDGKIADLPPLPKGSPIAISFTMDEMGTLRVHAVEASTGKELDIELAIAGLSKDDLDQARTAVAKYTVGT